MAVGDWLRCLEVRVDRHRGVVKALCPKEQDSREAHHLLHQASAWRTQPHPGICRIYVVARARQMDRAGHVLSERGDEVSFPQQIEATRRSGVNQRLKTVATTLGYERQNGCCAAPVHEARFNEHDDVGAVDLRQTMKFL